MNLLKIILGILAFSVVTAALYVWGLKKSITQPADLEQILVRKTAASVVKYLKRYGRIDMPGLVRLCQGAKGGQFWSRKRLVVQDAAAFAPKLVEYMKSQLLLEELPEQQFRLKK